MIKNIFYGERRSFASFRPSQNLNNTFFPRKKFKLKNFYVYDIFEYCEVTFSAKN